MGMISSGNENYNSSAYGFMAFSTSSSGNNGTEKMRITSSGEIGVGNVSPVSNYLIDAARSVNSTVAFNVKNGSNSGAASTQLRVTNSANTVGVLGIYSPSTTAYGAIGSGDTWLYSSSPGLVLIADNASGILKFATGGNAERMRIDASGRIGIAATTPSEKLTVAGRIRSTNSDIVVEDASRGIILKDGGATPHYWRITVSTSGVLSTTDLGISLPAE